jgi:8-oxo-dGTP pyrophosphatase MutT (NUDIX family)
MGADLSEAARLAGAIPRPARVSLRAGVRVHRVRCVLTDGRRFLLVQNNSRRPENRGKWSLPGGRLKTREQARAGVRREVAEELGLRVSYLVDVGDWWQNDEYHRVFGCEIEPAEPALQDDEILACAWLEYTDLKKLAAAGRLRWGFELEAISLFRRLPQDIRGATNT